MEFEVCGIGIRLNKKSTMRAKEERDSFQKAFVQERFHNCH